MTSPAEACKSNRPLRFCHVDHIFPSPRLKSNAWSRSIICTGALILEFFERYFRGDRVQVENFAF